MINIEGLWKEYCIYEQVVLNIQGLCVELGAAMV